MLFGDLIDLPAKGPGVFLENAGAFLGGEQRQGERPALAAQFQITAQKDEGGPGEANVAGDLLGPEEQSAPALRRPVGPRCAGFSARETLPEWETDEPDNGEGEDQQRPFAGRPMRWGQCHGFAFQIPGTIAPPRCGDNLARGVLFQVWGANEGLSRVANHLATRFLAKSVKSTGEEDAAS